MLPFCFSPPALFLLALLLYPAPLSEQGRTHVFITISGSSADIFPLIGSRHAHFVATRSQP